MQKYSQAAKPVLPKLGGANSITLRCATLALNTPDQNYELIAGNVRFRTHTHVRKF